MNVQHRTSNVQRRIKRSPKPINQCYGFVLSAESTACKMSDNCWNAHLQPKVHSVGKAAQWYFDLPRMFASEVPFDVRCWTFDVRCSILNESGKRGCLRKYQLISKNYHRPQCPALTVSQKPRIPFQFEMTHLIKPCQHDSPAVIFYTGNRCIHQLP